MSLAEIISTMTPEQLANFPLSPHPQLGYTYIPNFDHPDTTGPQSTIICSIFIGLAALAVSLRVICRVKVVKRTGMDDWASVAALLSCAAMAGLFVWLLDHKVMGPHSWDVRLVTFMRPQVAQLLFAIQMTGNTANFFAKASILLFVQRLFPRQVSPKTAYAIWFGIIANALAYVVLTIYLGVVCTPKNGAFPSTCPGTVLNHLGVGNAAVNALLDIFTLGVSVPTLWMLQMPIRRRISVVGVLSLGLVACGLSGATLAKRAMNDSAIDIDPTRTQVTTITLGVLEPLIATITACLPAMPALWAEISSKGVASFKRLLSRVRATSTTNSSKNASQYNGIDDGHSMKSLNSHGLTTLDDLERGDKIKVKTTLTSKTTRRDGTSF